MEEFIALSPGDVKYLSWIDSLYSGDFLASRKEAIVPKCGKWRDFWAEYGQGDFQRGFKEWIEKFQVGEKVKFPPANVQNDSASSSCDKFDFDMISLE